MLKKHKILLIIMIILIFVSCFINAKGEVIENLQIPIAFGVDVDTNCSTETYVISTLIQTFGDRGQTSSDIITSSGKTIGEARQSRQLKSDKRFAFGLDRVFFLGDSACRYGLRTLMDINLNDPDLNDKVTCVVCKGNAKDMLKHKMKNQENQAEYIEGMVKNLKEYNFFPQQYTIMDALVRIDSEGRNLLLPYIEFKDGDIQTTGLAVFNRDKMIGKANLEESKTINLLRENNVKGIITLEKNQKKYMNFYATSKRKVKCYRENDKYKFVIDLKLEGFILDNELFKNLYNDPAKIRELESDIASMAQKICSETIYKIRDKYKTDILELGRVAAAKYGRKKGIDWNNVITNSNIKVNVSVKVNNQGRGDY